MGLPYHDNFDDWYTITVHADGYQDAGIYPVRLMGGRLIDAYVMLIPRIGLDGYRRVEKRKAPSVAHLSTSELCSVLNQLPERNPSCLTPLTRLIPAASSGLSKPASAAS
jgi:hypothetical protein